MLKLDEAIRDAERVWSARFEILKTAEKDFEHAKDILSEAIRAKQMSDDS